jgi:hypothetical protein
MTKRERNLLIVLGVVAVAVGGFFLFTMLGGEPEEQAAPTPTASPPPIPATPGTGVGEPPSEEPPRAISFFGGRDPFVPLVVAEAGGGGTTPTEAEPAVGGEPTGGEVPTGEEPVEPAPDGAEAQEQPGTTVGGRQVALIDIVDSDTVQVSVDGETFTVDEGEQFAGNFEVVSVSGNCARFVFGDEGFTLCQGEAPK